ncbi:MAG TPA: hypothetical protein VG796_11725 [Verrucomicrobiales bacterium]|nr:hypothetical protein [Verrucomicrobiales bacterium]
MKRVRWRILVPVACLAAGFAGGSLLRRGRIPAGKTTSALVPRPAARPVTRLASTESPAVQFDRLQAAKPMTSAAGLKIEQLIMAMPPAEARKRIFTALLSGPDSFRRSLLWYRAAQEDPASLLSGLEVINKDADRFVFTGIFRAWVRRDPQAAAAAAKRDPLLLELCAAEWAAYDPAAAARAVESGVLPPERVEAIASAWMARDPSAALRWVDGIRDPKLMKGNPDFGGAATAVPAEAGNAAAEWRAETRLSLTLERIKSDPAAAFAELAATDWGRPYSSEKSNPKAPWNRLDDTIGIGLSTFAALSPEQAAKAAAALPQERLSPYIVSDMAGALEEAGPGTGLKWALSLADGSLRDAALTGCIFPVGVRGDLETAVDIINRMQSNEAKGNAATSIMNTWASYDPVGAGDWLTGLQKVLPAKDCAKAVKQFNEEVKRNAPSLTRK